MTTRTWPPSWLCQCVRAPDSYMVHLAISISGHDWLEPVSDADYASGIETLA